jgi:biopolymer transport protein TolR
MAASNLSVASAGGRGRRTRRRPVMADINVTPFVDVMLVLLIVFMVSAPLLTVGVPLELPQSQAKALQQDNQPIKVSVTSDGQIYLQDEQKTPIQLDDLIPKLKAMIEARGNKPDEMIYVRGDKNVDYGTMMRVMGRISGAGYHKVALITEVEQSGQ